MTFEKSQGGREVFRLVAEAREHAARHRTATLMNQKIGVSFRRQFRPEGKPGTVLHVGIEDFPHRNDVGAARSTSKNHFAGRRRHTVIKANLDTRTNCLVEQGTIQRAIASATSQQVEQGSLAVDTMRFGLTVKNDAFVHSVIGEPG